MTTSGRLRPSVGAASAVVLPYAALASTMHHVAWQLVAVAAWFVLAFRGGRCRAVWRAAAATRWFAAAAIAYAAVMAAVFCDSARNVAAPQPSEGHPVFGEHPVRIVAGWPWAGIEGSGRNHRRELCWAAGARSVEQARQAARARRR